MCTDLALLQVSGDATDGELHGTKVWVTWVVVKLLQLTTVHSRSKKSTAHLWPYVAVLQDSSYLQASLGAPGHSLLGRFSFAATRHVAN